MSALVSPPRQSRNCLDVLNHMLDLAMRTADAASADQNHRLVLQAVREVTRLVTLINKITTAAAKPGPALDATPRTTPATVGNNREKSGKVVGKIGLIEKFFKDNLPVKHQGKNVGVSALSGPKAQPDTAGTGHRPDEVLTPAAGLRPLRGQGSSLTSGPGLKY
jgi:hypothetical protein